MLLAGRDVSATARRHLFAEEVVQRQFRHDARKYQKKYLTPSKDAAGGKDSRKHSTSSAVAAANGALSASSSAVALAPPPPVLRRPPQCEYLDQLLEVRSTPSTC